VHQMHQSVKFGLIIAFSLIQTSSNSIIFYLCDGVRCIFWCICASPDVRSK